ncbi:MAG TPA: trehalose-6-phosphate synthase [Candidatus Limnocylindrales bacterium]|nr:trehalose-6-phosphate synthase [Candidatus Limnocylindrales bacterium]
MSDAETREPGGQLIIVANRLPVHRANGSWTASPGGLVSALTPFLKERTGSWIGWDGSAGAAPEPFDFHGIRQIPVPLNAREVEGYYKGFSNRTLWPLYHDAVRPPRFEPRWWKPFVDVNRRFAEYTAREAEQGATAWVHDYHLQLVPAMLRKLRPDLRIGFFLHIPFPPQELFAQLPWRRQLLEGLLGADFFACQTELGAKNFAELAVRYAEAQHVDGKGTLRAGDRLMRYGSLPISIDVAHFHELARRPEIRERAAEIRHELGEDRKVVLGVDRLDYTKGIDARLRTYGRLLDRGQISPEQCVLVQTAVPSRTDVLEYMTVREKVERLVGSINGRHGRIGRVAVHYLHQNLELEELVPLYLAADVMLVTPLRDGMNLVCKEYVATHVDGGGVLILSEFTGAAYELEEALLINPYDEEGMGRAIVRALEMSPEEAERRMAALRRKVAAHDVYWWAGEFLSALKA